MFRSLWTALAFACALVIPGGAIAAAAPFCAPNQSPAFAFGFATLSSQLGPVMGEPNECEHTNSANGDALQATTTSLAFYRKSTNTPTFTDGITHWALTSQGLVVWTGSSIDPPGTPVVAQLLYQGDPRRITLTVDDFGPGWMFGSSEEYLSNGLYVATFKRADNPRLSYEVYVKVSPDIPAAEAYWQSAMAGISPGYVDAPHSRMGDVSLAQWDAQGAVLRVRVKNVNLQVSTALGGPSLDALEWRMQLMVDRVNALAR